LDPVLRVLQHNDQTHRAFGGVVKGNAFSLALARSLSTASV